MTLYQKLRAIDIITKLASLHDNYNPTDDIEYKLDIAEIVINSLTKKEK